MENLTTQNQNDFFKSLLNWIEAIEQGKKFVTEAEKIYNETKKYLEEGN